MIKLVNLKLKMMTEKTRIRKYRKRFLYTGLLLVSVLILFIKSSIVSSVHSDKQLGVIEMQNLTIEQLNEHIINIEHKLEVAEIEIFLLKEDLITLKKTLNGKRNKRKLTVIDSISVFKDTNGNIIKIGN